MQQEASFMQSIQIIYFALLAGVLMMAGTLYFFVSDGNMSDELMSPFNFVIPGIAGFCLFLSHFLYSKRKAEGAQLKDVHEKMNHYRASFILRVAPLEGAALICIIIHFFMNQHWLYLACAGILLLSFLQAQPSLDQFAVDYELSESDKKIVEAAKA